MEPRRFGCFPPNGYGLYDMIGVIKGGRSAGDIFCDVGGQLPLSEVTGMSGHLERLAALASQKHTEDREKECPQ